MHYTEDDITDSFKKIDPINFGNFPVVQIYRNIFYYTFLTADGKLYVKSSYTFDMALEVPLPEPGFKVKQVMSSFSTGRSYILDTSGKVWVGRIEEYMYDQTSGMNWEPVIIHPDAPEDLVVITQMISIEMPYFLTSDNKVLYTGYYEGLDGTSFDNLEYNELDYTDLTNVAAFIPFYFPSIHSYFPTYKSTDGKIMMGYEILEHYGANTGVTQGMIDMAPFLPDAVGATAFVIGQDTDSYSAGNFVKNGKLFAINAGVDGYAENGLITDPDNPLPPLTITPLLDFIYVIDPDTPIFNGATNGNVNPTSVTLGPIQERTIPVEANWEILNRRNQVVKSGVTTLNGALAEIDIAGLNLPGGDYTISFYRETTTPALRSENTASSLFVIRENEGQDIIVKHVDESNNEIAPTDTLLGNVGTPYATEAKIVAGYVLKETPINANGLFTDTQQTVTYVYSKINGNIDSTLPETGDNSIIVGMFLLSIASCILGIALRVKKGKN